MRDILAPNSDGYRLHSIDLERIAGYAETLEALPLPWQIDMGNALAETRRRLWPELDEPRGLDE